MKHNVRSIRNQKASNKKLQMLTCYDYQTARMLNQTDLDLILVGDSLANVVLGLQTTVEVGLTEMKIFGSAVKRGAPEKFVVVDMPFGTYATFEEGIKNSIDLFQTTKAEAIKLEGSNPTNLDIIKRLTQTGIPVMGHIGLMPQSVHAQGGYYKHGKSQSDQERLLAEAQALEDAGCFSVVLEFVDEKVSQLISQALSIPTIGIGSGDQVDGQVLVINDLLGLGENAPGFVKPVANLFETKRDLIQGYLI